MINHFRIRRGIDITLTTVNLYVMENICIFMRNLILEINQVLGIQCLTHETGLEMQVRTGRTTCITTKGNRLASTNHIIKIYQEF